MLLGLVRHMRQMESSYLAWGLSGEGQADYYGEDDYPGGSVDSVDDDIRGWMTEMRRADAAHGDRDAGDVAAMDAAQGRISHAGRAPAVLAASDDAEAIAVVAARSHAGEVRLSRIDRRIVLCL